MVYKNETVTVADSAIGFTVANINLAMKLFGRPIKCVVFTLAVAEIRAWENGVDPTTTTGHIISVGDVVVVDGNNTESFRAIRTGGSSGIISIAYEV